MQADARDLLAVFDQAVDQPELPVSKRLIQAIPMLCHALTDDGGCVEFKPVVERCHERIKQLRQQGLQTIGDHLACGNFEAVVLTLQQVMNSPSFVKASKVVSEILQAHASKLQECLQAMHSLLPFAKANHRAANRAVRPDTYVEAERIASVFVDHMCWLRKAAVALASYVDQATTHELGNVGQRNSKEFQLVISSAVTAADGFLHSWNLPRVDTILAVLSHIQDGFSKREVAELKEDRVMLNQAITKVHNRLLTTMKTLEEQAKALPVEKYEASPYAPRLVLEPLLQHNEGNLSVELSRLRDTLLRLYELSFQQSVVKCTSPGQMQVLQGVIRQYPTTMAAALELSVKQRVEELKLLQAQLRDTVQKALTTFDVSSLRSLWNEHSDEMIRSQLQEGILTRVGSMQERANTLLKEPLQLQRTSDGVDHQFGSARHVTVPILATGNSHRPADSVGHVATSPSELACLVQSLFATERELAALDPKIAAQCEIWRRTRRQLFEEAASQLATAMQSLGTAGWDICETPRQADATSRPVDLAAAARKEPLWYCRPGSSTKTQAFDTTLDKAHKFAHSVLRCWHFQLAVSDARLPDVVGALRAYEADKRRGQAAMVAVVDFMSSLAERFDACIDQRDTANMSKILRVLANQKLHGLISVLRHLASLVDFTGVQSESTTAVTDLVADEKHGSDENVAHMRLHAVTERDLASNATAELAQIVNFHVQEIEAINFATRAEIRKNSSSRSSFFSNLNGLINFIQYLGKQCDSALNTSVAVGMVAVRETLEPKIEKAIILISKKLEALAEIVLNLLNGSSSWNDKQVEQLQLSMSCLQAAKEFIHAPTVNQTVHQRLEQINMLIGDRLTKVVVEAKRCLFDGNIVKLASELNTLQTMALNLPAHAADIQPNIDALLQCFSTTPALQSKIHQLAEQLCQMPNARSLVEGGSPHPMFVAFLRRQWSRLTGAQKIDTILKTMQNEPNLTKRISEAQAKSLMERYREFETEYKHSLQPFMRPGAVRDVTSLISSIRNEAESLPAYQMSAVAAEPAPIRGLRFAKVTNTGYHAGEENAFSPLVSAVAVAASIKPEEVVEKMKLFVERNTELCRTLLTAALPIPQYLDQLARGLNGVHQPKGDIHIIAHALSTPIMVVDWRGVLSSQLCVKQENLNAQAAVLNEPIFVCLNSRSVGPNRPALYDAFTYKFDRFLGFKSSIPKKSGKWILDKLLNEQPKRRANVIHPWWDKESVSRVPVLLGRLFALWTVKHASPADLGDSSDLSEFGVARSLLQPHPTQVIAIFRMLGIGFGSVKGVTLENSVVELLTGEGKSVVLGMCAALLALLGAEVSCACYSKHLSHRDQQAFSPIFSDLSVEKFVHYGTFDTLCEDMINRQGNVRDCVTDAILNSDADATPDVLDTESKSQAAGGLAPSTPADDERKGDEVDEVAMNALPSVSEPRRRVHVLLIDEMDTFCGESFYASVYSPAATIRHPAITKLFETVWAAEKPLSALTKQAGRAQIAAAARECKAISTFPGWGTMVDDAVKQMLIDMKTFQSHTYVLNKQTGKIGYAQHDSVNYLVSHGYKTLFAYFHEHERGGVSAAARDQQLALYLRCGSFAYAAIPLQFNHIMGITGTLGSLYPEQKAIIRDQYGFKRETFCPSQFGRCKFNFDAVKHQPHTLRHCDRSEYHEQIVHEINRRLVGSVGPPVPAIVNPAALGNAAAASGTAGSAATPAPAPAAAAAAAVTAPAPVPAAPMRGSPQRAVLVYFKDQKALQEFERHCMDWLPQSYQVMTEELDGSDVEKRVRFATTSGRVTLLTRAFGRGTDFVCRDDFVKANGGVHVIQTFFSDELSEEKQIQGRTARQNQDGSYSMVLCHDDLLKFFPVPSSESKEPEQYMRDQLTQQESQGRLVYDLLDEQRTKRLTQENQSRAARAGHLLLRHDYSLGFLTALRSGDKVAVSRFLVEQNAPSGGSMASNTVILLDATASTALLLSKIKERIVNMFQRAHAILQANVKESGTKKSFSLQIAAYRNYNAPQEQILQCSGFETDPQVLQTFLDGVIPTYGMGKEAIEVGLFHVNEQLDAKMEVSQVIIIGDAGPQSVLEAHSKRKKCEVDPENKKDGTAYWNATRFRDVVDYEAELDKILANDIPVHTFYVARAAAADFEQMHAAAVKMCPSSRCEFLDVNDEVHGAEVLTHVITEELLRSVGGDELVLQYRGAYGNK